MQFRQLVSVEIVTDSEVSGSEPGDFDFGVPALTNDWLDAEPGRPLALANWMRWLADQCEARSAPFLSTPKPVAGQPDPREERTT